MPSDAAPRAGASPHAAAGARSGTTALPAAGGVADLNARAERHDVDHRGRRVVWRGFGQGAPLVLLHGGHGNWLHWAHNIDALAGRHRVWLADMPGFGDSDELDLPPHAPNRQPQLLQALMATLDRLIGAGAPIALAGFSFGGLTAAQLAAARGGVTRLALLGPGGHGSRRPRDVPLADWRLANPDARQAALRQNLQAFLLHDPARADAQALAIHTQACEATRYRSKDLSRADGLQAALDQAAVPTLLLWGEHDVTGVPAELGPVLTAGHSEREWALVPAAGHWVQYESAAAVNARLLAWFSAGAGTSRS